MPACLVSGIFHTRLLSQVRAKIFLSLIQVLSQIGHIFGIAFPPIFAGVLKWAGVLQLDIFSAMPLNCMFDTNFHTMLLLRTLTPLTVMTILGVWGMRITCSPDTTTRKGASRVWLGNLLINLVFLILFVVYPSIASNVRPPVLTFDHLPTPSITLSTALHAPANSSLSSLTAPFPHSCF